MSTGQGNWSKGTKVRRIDGIGFNELEEIPDGIYKINSPSEFTNLLKKVKTIDLIEIKTTLNRLVIGQVIAGIDMFKREYGNIHINPVIICSKSDLGMEWVCENRGIEVFIYES